MASVKTTSSTTGCLQRDTADQATAAARRTSQGAVIEQVLIDQARALSVAELLSAARAHQPRIGRATVYRHLKRLVAEGAVHAVSLPGEEAPRYEAAGRQHHHHFHCTRCDRVFDLPGCPSGLSNLVPNGFRLERHQVVLAGACAQCRTS